MRQFLHPPFADKSCDTCHAPAKDGKVVLTQADVKSLCVTCHDDKAKQIESAKVPHPGAAGDCTDCHNPHASRQPGLPKTNAVDICLACHTDQAEQGKKHFCISPHSSRDAPPATSPTAATNDHLLRAQEPTPFAWSATARIRSRKKLEAEHVLTIFNGKVKLPEDYFAKNKVVVLPLKFGRGTSDGGSPGVRCDGSDGHHQGSRQDRLPVLPPAAFLGASPICW